MSGIPISEPLASYITDCYKIWHFFDTRCEIYFSNKGLSAELSESLRAKKIWKWLPSGHSKVSDTPAPPAPLQPESPRIYQNIKLTVHDEVYE